MHRSGNDSVKKEVDLGPDWDLNIRRLRVEALEKVVGGDGLRGKRRDPLNQTLATRPVIVCLPTSVVCRKHQDGMSQNSKLSWDKVVMECVSTVNNTATWLTSKAR